MKHRNKLDPSLSRQFAAMSFLSAILIVALHSLGIGSETPPIRWLYRFIHDGLCLTAIPWFFFASGYFVAGHIDEEGWWRRSVAKRVRTLLVPFWIWSAVCWLYYVSVAIMISIMGYEFRGPNALELVSWLGFLRVVGLDWYDTMNTMWYMRTLFVLVCFSVLLIRLPKWGACILFVVSCLFYVHPPINQGLAQLGNNLFSVRGLFYFSWGLLCRKNSFDFRKIPMWLVGCGGITLSVINILDVEMGWGCRWFAVLQLPPLMLFVFKMCGKIKMPDKLVSLSFPVYVIHMMVVYFVTGVYAVLGCGGFENMTLIKGIVRFVFALGVSLLLGWLIKVKCPRVAAVVFGGR